MEFVKSLWMVSNCSFWFSPKDNSFSLISTLALSRSFFFTLCSAKGLTVPLICLLTDEIHSRSSVSAFTFAELSLIARIISTGGIRRICPSTK